MTAYGRATIDSPLGRFVVEIQSVNRKYLDIHTSVPSEMTRFDVDLRKWISENVFRGRVNVKITAIYDQKTPFVVRPDLTLAKEIKHAWDVIATALKLPQERGFTLEMLTQEANVLKYEEAIPDEEELRETLKEVVTVAVGELQRMKVKEGDHIQKDLMQRLSKIESLLNQIDERSEEAPNKYREKLKQRIEEILPGSAENEERILREIAIYADRVDISEEITRFRSHLKQFEELMASDKEAIGKILDFLIQEMFREVNTIGSKTEDVKVSQQIVEIKTELERIREQIQNVE